MLRGGGIFQDFLPPVASISDICNVLVLCFVSEVLYHKEIHLKFLGQDYEFSTYKKVLL